MLISSLADTAISIGIWIVSGIYLVASWAFEVFLVLATGQVVNQGDYKLIIQNFYIVLGIVLLFFLAFSLLKGMVNPDDQKQGTSTIKKVVINLVTSAIIMAVLPTIFGFLYDFQTSFIVKQNVIGRFFGYGSLSDTSGDLDSNTNRAAIEQGAFQIVNGVYTAFFNVNLESCPEQVIDSVSLRNCQGEIKDIDSFLFIKWRNEDLSFADVIDHVNSTGQFNAYNDLSRNVEKGEIEFQFLLSVIAGLALIYVGVSFCFDMALRMVKLVFYQIIAPIPIFARVIPEGKFSDSFNKWLKVTLTCYMEVYTRIFIFYFVVYLCKVMLASDFLNKELYRFDPIIGLLGKAFLLMGMVMFMKQAPKLISDVTGIDSGNMKLGIRDKLKDGGFFTAGAAVGAGLTGLTRNAVNAYGNIKNKWGDASLKEKAGLVAGGLASTIAGGGSAFARGGKAGWKAGSFGDMKNAAGKGAKGAVDARNARADRNTRYQAMGKNAITGKAADFGANFVDWATGGTDRYAGQIKAADEMVKSYDSIEAQATKVYEKFKNKIGLRYEAGSKEQFIKDLKLKDASRDYQDRMWNLYSRYNGMSMAAIQSDIANKSTEDVSKRINREAFFDNAGYRTALDNAISSISQSSYFDNAGYNSAVERARQSVSKNDFMKRVGNRRVFDEKAYNTAVETAVNSVSRNDYFDATGYKSAIENARQSVSRESFFDMNSYNDALNKATLEHNQEIADLNSMFKQMEKKSILQVAQGALNIKNGKSDPHMAEVSTDDLAAVSALIEDLNARYKANGNAVTDPHDTSKTFGNINLTSDDAMDALKGIADAYKNIGTDAKAASADLRLKAEQRKKDK